MAKIFLKGLKTILRWEMFLYSHEKVATAKGNTEKNLWVSTLRGVIPRGVPVSVEHGCHVANFLNYNFLQRMPSGNPGRRGRCAAPLAAQREPEGGTGIATLRLVRAFKFATVKMH